MDINGKRYIIRPISYSHKYLAEKLYEETLEELKMDKDFFSRDDDRFKFILIREGLKPSYKDDMKKISDEIEESKLSLYEIVNEKGDDSKIVDKIKTLNKDLLDILASLHQKDSVTIEGIADMQKTRYLIRTSLNKKVDESELNSIISWLGQNYIKEEDYRKIARSSALNDIVSAGKPFKNYPLTDEQITLMHWYRFYKNVYEHPERPFDWVIDNDWALDGWCIKQSKKNKTEDAKRYVDSKITSDAVRNSTEVFIPRQPGTDMSKIIDDANSPEAKAYKKAKFALINRGKLDESTDVKLAESF